MSDVCYFENRSHREIKIFAHIRMLVAILFMEVAFIKTIEKDEEQHCQHQQKSKLHKVVGRLAVAVMRMHMICHGHLFFSTNGKNKSIFKHSFTSQYHDMQCNYFGQQSARSLVLSDGSNSNARPWRGMRMLGH